MVMAGAFPSWPMPAKANWKIVDSKLGIIKEGCYEPQALEDPLYCKPSDGLRLMSQVQAANMYRPLPGAC